MKKYILTGFAAALLVWVPTSPVTAQNSRAEDAQARAQERRAAVQQRVEQKRAEVQQRVEERKAEVQERVCERREAAIQRVIPRLGNGAVNVKSAIDNVYTRVQGFYEDGQLTVENYDELKANVDDAKIDAEAALQLVEDYEFEFDCEVRGVGQQLDEFRSAIHDARDELKIYRDELVTLISSLRAEAASEGDDDSANEEESEDENEEAAENETEDEVKQETEQEEEVDETQ